MMHVILATALLLHAADTVKPPVAYPRFSAAAVIAPAGAAVARTLSAPPVFGEDKLRHFLMSDAVYTFAYAGEQSVGMNRKSSLMGAFGAVAVIGFGKELFDAKAGKPFSGYDLVADLLGGVAGYALMKQVR